MDNICENCKRWVDTACTLFSIDDDHYPHNNDEFGGFKVTVADDTNLHVELRTSPTFGCNEFDAQLEQEV